MEFQVSSIVTPGESIRTIILAVSLVPSSTAANVIAKVSAGDNVDQVFLPFKTQFPFPDQGTNVVAGRPPPLGEPKSGSDAKLFTIAPSRRDSLKT